MAVVKGFMAIAALKKGSAWGTAATCGAGNGIEILSESITGGSALIERNMLSGDSQRRVGVAGPETYSGSIEADVVYEQVGLPIALVMGTATTSGTQAPYTHTITVLDDLEGVYGTFAVKADTLEVHEYESVKFNGFELSASAGEPAKIRFDVIPNDLNVNTSSGNNTLTTMTNVTYNSDRERALFSQGVFRIAAASTATGLTSGNAVCLESFSVNLSRNMQGKITTCDGTNIKEPQPNDFITVSGSFTVPYWDATASTLHTWALGKTELMADLVFTGASASKNMKVYLSGVQIEGKPNVSGAGANSVSFNFMAHAVATANSNFPSTDALGVTLALTTGTALLA